MQAWTERYRKYGSPPSMDGMLGVASLGPHSDRVPLVGENRIIASAGVREILAKRRVAFKVLRSHVWIEDESALTEVLARMVPMVGASRSSEGGNLGCELLLATEEDDAEEVLSDLIHDAERKRDQARRAMDRVPGGIREEDLGGKAIVLVQERLPAKAVGFCTSRLAAEHHKPVVIITVRGDSGNGEARAPKGVDLVEALSAHRDFFLGYGGHKQAAGFTIDRDRIDDFVPRLKAYMEAHVDSEALKRQIVIDCPVGVEDLRLETIKDLLRLEPFGEENRRPVFILESLSPDVLKEIDGTYRIGEVLVSGEQFISGKAWENGNDLDLVISPFSEGSTRIVEVVDWRKAK
jgi:single-stranded-DNA-specific exonuclease